MTKEEELSKKLEKFIDEENTEMILQCPCYALDPSIVGYNEMKNPSKDYQSYLTKVKEYLDDFRLRQIYFDSAKLSIRKYFPNKSYIIESYKSEEMCMKDLDKIISKLNTGEKMKIEEVPEGHWMLLDTNRNVIYHAEKLGDVAREGKKYPLNTIVIERKFTGLIF